LLLVLSVPLWPLLLLASLAADMRRPFRRVRLIGNRSRPGVDGQRERLVFTGVESATAVPVLRHLPKLFAVLRGDLHVVGVRPLTPELAAARREAWERLRDEAPAGLFGPAQIELAADAPDEERTIAEVFYARTRSLTVDLRLLARGCAALCSRRAWIGARLRSAAA
jgi:Bacterial sugar transferase